MHGEYNGVPASGNREMEGRKREGLELRAGAVGVFEVRRVACNRRSLWCESGGCVLTLALVLCCGVLEFPPRR